MAISFCILLLIIGLWVYLDYRKYIYHYFLLWICFGPVVVSFFYTLNDEYWQIQTWTVYLSYAIVLIDIVKHGGIKDKWARQAVVLVLTFILYYIILSLLRGAEILKAVRYIVGHFGFLVSLCIISQNPVNSNSLVKLIRAIVFTEILLALVQPYFSFLNYQSTMQDEAMTTMVNGTFIRNNVFIEFLTPLVMLLVYYDYIHKKRGLWMDYLLVLLTLFLTYNSGVRTVFLAILPVIFVVIYRLLSLRFKTTRGKILATIIICLSSYTIYGMAQSLAEDRGITYTKNAEDSSDRQAVLLSILNDPEFAENQTTLGFTIIVLSTFPDNPIWGPGNMFKGNGYDFIKRESGDETDATLAILLCEVGLVGMLLLAIIYYFIISKIGHNEQITRMIFFYLLIVTIADPGLIYFGNMLVLFISMKISFVEKKKVLAV